MAIGTNLRIYNSPFRGGTRRRKHKGKSKKVRRLLRADWADGWSRKRSNTLAPHHYPSKRILEQDMVSWGL